MSHLGDEVMVRCFQGRVKRVRIAPMKSRYPGTISVCGNLSDSAIGFPERDVFERDEALAAEIEAAFEVGEKPSASTLGSLWARAKRYSKGTA